jgi:hypothetical protein
MDRLAQEDLISAGLVVIGSDQNIKRLGLVLIG